MFSENETAKNTQHFLKPLSWNHFATVAFTSNFPFYFGLNRRDDDILTYCRWWFHKDRLELDDN